MGENKDKLSIKHRQKDKHTNDRQRNKRQKGKETKRNEGTDIQIDTQ